MEPRGIKMSRLKLTLITLAVVSAVALALVLKLIVFAPKPEELGWTLEIEPLKAHLAAAPGEFITQVFSLTYNEPASGATITRAGFSLSLKAPEGWQVLGLDEVNPITLKPGESRRVFVTIGVPSHTPPGDYDLAIHPTLSDLELPEPQAARPAFHQVLLPTATATFTIRVEPTAIPKVEPRSPRAEAEAGGRIELHFSVTNRGNTEGSFKLKAETPPGWGAELPQKVELGPGESQEVKVSVQVPPDAPPKVEKIILKAEAKGSKSEATVKVTVLPH